MKLFAQVFVTILVIMDPIGNVPVFLALTRDADVRARRRAAWHATAAAGVIVLGFAAFGEQLLQVLDISLEAVQVSGGLLLVLVALELLRGTGERQPSTDEGMNVALVPLGTPLLAGPGAIAATIVYIRDADSPTEVAVVIAALVSVLVVVYLALFLGVRLAGLLKTTGVLLLSQVVGVLLAAIAVQLVATGVQSWVDDGVQPQFGASAGLERSLLAEPSAVGAHRRAGLAGGRQVSEERVPID